MKNLATLKEIKKDGQAESPIDQFYLIELLKESIVKWILLVASILVSFLVYTYDRSFRVHQKTVAWAHEWNMRENAHFVYDIHVGHDGTTLKPILRSPPAAPPAPEASQAAPPVPEASQAAPPVPVVANSPTDVPSPLDQFDIVPFLPFQIGKLYFSFTNSSFFLLLTLSFVLFSIYLVTKKGGGKSVPNAWQSQVELIYDFVPNLVNEQIGGLSGNVKQKFFPCISVTFIFLLFRNLQGMIPYSFTVTSHFIVTLGLSFSLFIGITIVGFAKNGLHFLSFSLPAGVPLPLAPFLVLLELIPHCFRALSLGIRLFANMMAGHSLVKILSGFAWTMLCMNDLFYFIGSTVPFFIVLALTGLELGVAILQAYVFTILMCIYLNDAINLH